MKRRKMGGIVPPRVRVDKKPKLLFAMDAKIDPPLDMQTIFAITIESERWVTGDFLWCHEWITETKVTMK